MCVHVVEICPKWKRNNRDTFNVFGRDLISCNFEGKNLEKDVSYGKPNACDA